MGNRFYYGMPSTQAFQAMNTLDDDVQAKSAAAMTAAQAAASSAAQAANARDAALTAWQASTAPNEQLAALSKQFHTGSVVDVFMYDTGKDSDGGAWRKRCQHTSWYGEPLSSSWLGAASNELSARGDNLLSAPEDIATWTNNGSDAVASYGTTPEGNTASTRISTGTRYKSMTGLTNGALYAGMHIVKASGGTAARIYMDATGGTITNATFTFATETFSGLSTNVVATGFKKLTDDGWYLIWAAFTATGTSGSFHAYPVGGVEFYAAKLNQVGIQASSYSGSSERIANGDLSLGTARWTLPASFIVASSMLHSVPPASGNEYAYATGSFLSSGKVYHAVFTIKNSAAAASNGVRLAVGATTLNSSSYYSANGTYEVVFVAPVSGDFGFIRNSAHVGALDIGDISVKEVTVMSTPYVSYSQLASSYYQNTTDGRYYSLNSGYGVTEVFRGKKAEFPALALIVLEASRMIIYDATTADLSMWMVLQGSSTGELVAKALPGGLMASVVAVNGTVFVGSADSGAWWCGLWSLEFAGDSVKRRFWSGTNSGTFRKPSGLALRNTAETFVKVSTATIVHSTVYDIAVTVLADAPCDTGTGLPIPTVAVGTAGGISIIKHDGTIVNDTATGNASANASRVGFTLDGRLMRSFGTDNRRLGLYVGGGLKVPASSASLSANWDIIGDLPTAAGVPYTPAISVAQVVGARDYIALANSGMSLLKHNPANRASSMLAYLTNSYTTGWMVGNICGAWLADTTAEILSGPELVANGTFSSTSGWVSAGSLSVVNGALRVTVTGGNQGAYTLINTVPGKRYRVVLDLLTNSTGTKGTFVYIGSVAGASDLVNSTIGISSGILGKTVEFIATTATTSIMVAYSSVAISGDYFDIDNVTCRQVDPDRSVNGYSLGIYGSVTKSPVATGSELVGYTGFSSSTYLEQPYNPNLNFGTGDFYVMGWANITDTATGQYLFSRGSGAAPLIAIYISGGTWGVICHGTGAATNTNVALSSGLHHVVLMRASSFLYLYVDGVMVWSQGNAVNVTNSAAVCTLGVLYTHAIPFLGSMALWRIGATAPSADQIAQIYRDELALFQPGTPCTIDGTSASVTSIAYDDTADVLHVGTSWGRSGFHGLQRIDSAVTSVGPVSAISAGQGAHVTGGAGGARYQQPSIVLRDELRRTESRTAGSREAMRFDFDASAGMTDFTLPSGWSVRDVLVAGVRKRLGATKDYIVSFDGYRETVRFATSPGVAWIQVAATRSHSG